ncbi:hypothetical protein BDV12DRAFT_200910 [Aspergillus spectabilis]
MTDLLPTQPETRICSHCLKPALLDQFRGRQAALLLLTCQRCRDAVKASRARRLHTSTATLDPSALPQEVRAAAQDNFSSQPDTPPSQPQSKTCGNCGKEKPIAQFQGLLRAGTLRTCQRCRSFTNACRERRRNRINAILNQQTSAPHPARPKRCRHCERVQPINQFLHRNGSRVVKTCQKCRDVNMASWARSRVRSTATLASTSSNTTQEVQQPDSGHDEQQSDFDHHDQKSNSGRHDEQSEQNDDLASASSSSNSVSTTSIAPTTFQTRTCCHCRKVKHLNHYQSMKREGVVRTCQQCRNYSNASYARRVNRRLLASLSQESDVPLSSLIAGLQNRPVNLPHQESTATLLDITPEQARMRPLAPREVLGPTATWPLPLGFEDWIPGMGGYSELGNGGDSSVGDQDQVKEGSEEEIKEEKCGLDGDFEVVEQPDTDVL